MTDKSHNLKLRKPVLSLRTRSPQHQHQTLLSSEPTNMSYSPPSEGHSFNLTSARVYQRVGVGKYDYGDVSTSPSAKNNTKIFVPRTIPFDVDSPPQTPLYAQKAYFESQPYESVKLQKRSMSMEPLQNASTISPLPMPARGQSAAIKRKPVPSQQYNTSTTTIDHDLQTPPSYSNLYGSNLYEFQAPLTPELPMAYPTIYENTYTSYPPSSFMPPRKNNSFSSGTTMSSSPSFSSVSSRSSSNISPNNSRRGVNIPARKPVTKASISSLSNQISRHDSEYQLNKLFLFKTTLKRTNYSAYNILATFYPNASSYEAYHSIYTQFQEVIQDLIDEFQENNLVYRSSLRNNEFSSETMELALWTIWDFCLTFKERPITEPILEHQLSFLYDRCDKKQLFEISKCWQYLHSLLYPLNNIITIEEIADSFGGDREAERQIEYLTDYICSVGLDHILSLCSLTKHQTTSGHHTVYDYLVKEDILPKFSPREAMDYARFLKEPVRRLYTKLEVESRYHDVDGVVERRNAGWGPNNVLEDHLEPERI